MDEIKWKSHTMIENEEKERERLKTCNSCLEIDLSWCHPKIWSKFLWLILRQIQHPRMVPGINCPQVDCESWDHAGSDSNWLTDSLRNDAKCGIQLLDSFRNGMKDDARWCKYMCQYVQVYVVPFQNGFWQALWMRMQIQTLRRWCLASICVFGLLCATVNRM